MAFLAIMGDVEKSERHCLLFYRVANKCDNFTNKYCYKPKYIYDDSIRSSSTTRYISFNLVKFITYAKFYHK